MAVSWWHQAITWTNVDLLSIWFFGIHMGTIPLEMLKISVTKLHLKIKYLKSQIYLRGNNELNSHTGTYHSYAKTESNVDCLIINGALLVDLIHMD